MIIRSTHVHSNGRGADLPFFLRFDHSSILVKINLQHSQALPYGICIMHSCYVPNPNSFICGTSHREAVSTIFKVFGMTRPRVD